MQKTVAAAGYFFSWKVGVYSQFLFCPISRLMERRLLMLLIWAAMWAAGTLFKCSRFADVIAPAVHLVVSPELTLLCFFFLGDSGNAKLRLRTAARSVRKATKKTNKKLNICTHIDIMTSWLGYKKIEGAWLKVNSLLSLPKHRNSESDPSVCFCSNSAEWALVKTRGWMMVHTNLKMKIERKQNYCRVSHWM